MQNGHSGAPAPPLSVENINQKVKEAEYAVRGAIAIKAQQYQSDLEAGKALPFKKIVACNIGNPQLLGQKPVTFFRQVLSLCDYPELLDHPGAADIFPADAVARARKYLSAIPGGTGAYSESKGARVLRADVAAGIAARDGHSCDPEDLWLTDGASPAVHYLMRVLLRNEGDAVLTPIPQYPLYSATIVLYGEPQHTLDCSGGTLLPYYLSEAENWQTGVDHLAAQVESARAQGKCVRALVVINPGNPTGQVLPRNNQEDLVRFAKKENLVLIADEVYQTNIYAEGKQFHSFKKVLRDMGPDFASVPLVSLNSISKGFVGECGRRGGYMECVNFPPAVKEQLYKLSSISLCPNLSGQITMALFMSQPQPGDPSYERFAAERDAILQSLTRRARLVAGSLNELEGVSCNEVEGAMYAFPRITLPPAALEAAARAGKAADFLYCMELLDKTGIVTVPGSGFGQEKGTLHLRTTILPPEEDMRDVAERMASFHRGYLAGFSK